MTRESSSRSLQRSGAVTLRAIVGRTRLFIVGVAMLYHCAAASDLKGLLGMNFEGAAEKQEEYIQRHGFENKTCSE